MKNYLILMCILLNFSIQNANAGIVYTNLSPDSVVQMTIDPTFGTGSGSNLSNLDIDNNGTTDLNFRYNVSPGFGWFLHAVEQNNAEIMETSYNSATISNPYALVLDVNDFIGSSQNWSSISEPLIGDTTDYNFGGQGNKYLGIKFLINTDVHYGWIMLEFDNIVNPKELYVKEYAYNDVANSPIAAGQTTGPPPVPELEMSISSTDYPNNGTYDFGISNVGAQVNVDFFVKNSGTTDLLLSNIAISGLNTADYLISNNPDTVIVPGDSSTISLSFTPSTTGTRTAIISFNSNDNDENPFTINLTGEGQNGGGGGGSSMIVVKKNNTVIQNGQGNYDFGIVQVGSALTEDFVIVNLDSLDVSIEIIDIFATGGTPAFSTSLSAPLNVTAGDSVVFPITFTPGFNGIQNGFVIVSNFVSGLNYSFEVEGEGAGGNNPPGLLLEESGTVYASFGTYDYGNVPEGSTVTADFVLKLSNVNNPVSIDFVDVFSFTGGNEFSVNISTPFTISPGDSVIIPVEYNPTGIGLHEAQFFIQPDFSSNIQDIQLSLRGEGVNAVLMTSLEVYGQGNVAEINVANGTLQMIGDILPVSATNQNLAWTVDNTSIASISSSGELQAIANGTVIVTGTSTDGSGLSDTAHVELKNQTTSLSDVDKASLTVFPVPTNNMLNIKNKNDLEVAFTDILSLDGKQIRHFQNLPAMIDIQEFPSGIYILRITTKEMDQYVYQFKKK